MLELHIPRLSHLEKCGPEKEVDCHRHEKCFPESAGYERFAHSMPGKFLGSLLLKIL